MSSHLQKRNGTLIFLFSLQEYFCWKKGVHMFTSRNKTRASSFSGKFFFQLCLAAKQVHFAWKVLLWDTSFRKTLSFFQITHNFWNEQSAHHLKTNQSTTLKILLHLKCETCLLFCYCTQFFGSNEIHVHVSQNFLCCKFFCFVIKIWGNCLLFFLMKATTGLNKICPVSKSAE